MAMLNEDKQRESFGENLRDLRESLGMSQKQLSKILGISPAAYLFYEQGKNEPTLKNLKKIAGIFDVTVDYLLSSKDNEQEEYERAVSKWQGCDFQIEEEENFIIIKPIENQNNKSKLLPLKLPSKAEFIKITREIEADSKEIEMLNFKALANRITSELAIRRRLNPHNLIGQLVPVELL